MSRNAQTNLSTWMIEDSYFEDLAVFSFGPLHPGGMRASRELFYAREWTSADVLDVGCGNGTTAKMLQELGAVVTCVEPSYLMREAAKQQGIDADRIIPSTLEELRLSDNQRFGAIIIEGVIGFVASPAEHVLKLLKHLELGGDLFICDWMTHARQSISEYGFTIHGAFNPSNAVSWLLDRGMSCTMKYEPVVAQAFDIDIEEACRRASLFFGCDQSQELRTAVVRKRRLLKTALKKPINTSRYVLRATLQSQPNS